MTDQEKIDARREIEEQIAAIWRELRGGTEVNPIGIKGELMRLKDSIAELDTGQLQQILALLSPAETKKIIVQLAILEGYSLRQQRDDIVKLKSNEIKDGQARFSTLENRVAAQQRLLWIVGTGVIGAIVGSIMQNMGS